MYFRNESTLLELTTLYSATQRSGRREELLKGPVAYGIVHGLAAMVFWRHSAAGIATIACLCAGDGLAEVVGTRLGASNPLPFNPRKVCCSCRATSLDEPLTFCPDVLETANLLVMRWLW